MKKTLKKIIRFLEKLTNTQIIHNKHHGIDVFHDIKIAMPQYSIEIIFDVGANIGQSAISYKSRFPFSHVFCFEPISKTFNKLVENIKSYSNIQCFKIAISSSCGVATMLSNGTSSNNRLKNSEKDASNSENHFLEQVNLVTLDEFCKLNTISHIDYLKIDTEGNDLEVLKGAKKILSIQEIDFIEVEAGMNLTNTFHVPFFELKDYLEKHQYRIFGIYQQYMQWNEPFLRRANAVFISNKMIRKFGTPSS